MRTTRLFLIGAIGAMIFSVAGSAAATPGSTQDPDDASFEIDIRAWYHHDDANNVVYYMQAYDNFDDQGWFCVASWDFDENRTQDAHVTFSLEYGPSAYVAQTTVDGGEDQVGDAQMGRSTVGGPHAPQGSTPQNTIRVVVPKSLMRQAGMGANDSGYNYAFGCGMADQDWADPQYGDEVANWETFPIRHDLGGTATPPAATPVPKTATPSTPNPPTQAPSQPTPAPPTPDTTAPPSSEQPTPTIDASASPGATSVPLTLEETSSGGGGALALVAVVAVLGGLIAVGAFALARRREV